MDLLDLEKRPKFSRDLSLNHTMIWGDGYCWKTHSKSRVSELSSRCSKRERKFRKAAARANENGPLHAGGCLITFIHVYWEDF